MNVDALLTAMTAKADQAIAKQTVEVGEMVKAYQALVAAGDDRAVAMGTLVLAGVATLSPHHACQLLSVAVAMLAERPAEGGEAC